MQKKTLLKYQVSKMLFLGILLLPVCTVSAQDDPEVAARTAKRYMQEAEAAKAEDDMASAEAFYRKAIATDPSNAEAKFNLGNLYYEKEITGQAVERHGQAAKVTESKGLKHDSFHNRGNAFMKEKKYKEAIEAYKNSLRNNPSDDQTRYNLALAKKMLEEEQKKGGGDDNKDQNKDQNKDKQDQNKDQQDKKDQQGDQGEKEKSDDGKPQDEKDKGGEKEDQDKKEGEDKKDDEGKPRNKDEQQQEQGGDKKEEQQKQPQPRPGQLSPQQVKNLLEAMGNEEKKIQDKINAQKVKGAKTKTEKDW